MRKTVKIIYSLDVEDPISLAGVVTVIRAGLEHLVSEHQLKYHDDLYVELDRWCLSAEKELRNIER